MKQSAFEKAHQPEWTAFTSLLEALEKPSAPSRPAPTATDSLEFAARYRCVCQQLSLAQRRGYSTRLCAALHDLVQRGHLLLYRPAPLRWRLALDFLAREFPRLVRLQWRAMAVSSVLFFAPLIGLIVALQYQPEWIHWFVDENSLREYEAMYDPNIDRERLGRQAGSDVKMFGYYVLNNVSIGFRCFASGLLFAVGPLLVLGFNGISIGGIAGHLTAIGHGAPFWRFVVGHSGPELIAIAIAGGAGLQLGFALIAPGQRSRLRALTEAGALGAKLAMGVFAMLVGAAVIEAFFSSVAWIPDLIRFPFGIGLWLLILAWLGLGGRKIAA